jgi:hypothetical protein
MGFKPVGVLKGMPQSDILGATPPQRGMLLYGSRQRLREAIRYVSKGQLKETPGLAESKVPKQVRKNRIHLKLLYGIPTATAFWIITHNIRTHLVGNIPYAAFFPGYLFLHAVLSELFEPRAVMRRSFETLAKSAVDFFFGTQMAVLTGGLGFITLHYSREAGQLLNFGGLVNHHYLWTTILNGTGISAVVQAAYRWHEAWVWRQPNPKSVARMQRFFYGIATFLLAVGIYGTIAVMYFNDRCFYTIWCAARNPLAGTAALFIGSFLPKVIRQPTTSLEKTA